MEKLIIIDGNAIVHRAFHAIPPFTNNALYGFISFFIKTVKEHEPDFIVAAFDLHGPTFRHKEYADYKATRKKAPDDLYAQIPEIKKFLNEAGVPIFEKKGYEADDVIGTISEKAPNSIEVIIMTGDFDTLQLVKKNVKVFCLKRGVKEGVLFDEKKVREKYLGLSPKDLVDFKALRGDPSDNIPGVSGIGEKTAIEIIKKFKSIENLYKNIDSLKDSLADKIIKDEEKAIMSKRLSEIKKDVPISFDIKNCYYEKNKEAVVKFLEKHNFKSLISRFSGKKNMTLL